MLAEIDLGAIEHNLGVLRRAAAGSDVMAVVKADAYGHGMLPVARSARRAGAKWLGVALPSEAVALRRDGDRGPILAWLFVPSDDLAEAVALDVDISAGSLLHLEGIARAARHTGRRARVHLKVDTGLGRGGATYSDWTRLVDSAKAAQREGLVEVVGIWSHLACADVRDQVFTRRQCGVFVRALQVAEERGLRPAVRHLASSGAILFAPEAHFDLVRCGISLYGLSAGHSLGAPEDQGLRPAMTLMSEIAHVKRVPAGHGVSYGHRYRTTADTTLALVPVGYADGIPRAASGLLPVSIDGVRFTAAGTVAMDQFVVDVGDADVAPGDSVVLFGSAARGGPTAEDWAEASGSIVNEVVTRIGPRVPRSFIGQPGDKS